MTTSAQSVAKFLIQNSGQMSNLKLQKLLYYAQGWHLGIHEKALFIEPIEAWRHGPVVPKIFHLYREFKWSPIEIDSKPADVPVPVARHLKAILKAYGGWSAAQLEMQSHCEAPWKEARKDLPVDASSRNVITHESMKRYFGRLANG